MSRDDADFILGRIDKSRHPHEGTFGGQVSLLNFFRTLLPRSSLETNSNDVNGGRRYIGHERQLIISSSLVNVGQCALHEIVNEFKISSFYKIFRLNIFRLKNLLKQSYLLCVYCPWNPQLTMNDQANAKHYHCCAYIRGAFWWTAGCIPFARTNQGDSSLFSDRLT